MRFAYYEIRPCVDFGDEVRSFLGEEEYDPCLGHHHTWQGALKEAETAGLPVFWTIYGRAPHAVAIGDFHSFQAAYEVLQAILLPIRAAIDATPNQHQSLKEICFLEDLCNQSSTEERL